MKSIIFIGLSCLILACTKNYEPTRPEIMLDGNKMVQLLTDIHVIEAQVEVERLQNTQKENELFQYKLDSLFKSNGIDSLTFYSNFDYFYKKKALLPVYEQILHEIDHRVEVSKKARVRKQSKKLGNNPKKKPTSLNNPRQKQ